MSLIERAVSKLGNATPRTVPTPEKAVAAVQAAARAARPIEPIGGEPAAGAPAARTAAPADAKPAATVPTHLNTVQIDLQSLQARGFVTPDGSPGAVGHDFRIVKRPLLSNAFGRNSESVRNGRRVMVTSAFPGEGKSFCAINLAISIAAERDHAVLLVDADVAKPSIPTALGISTQRGLMDWLIDGAPAIEQLVMSTNVEKLSILPSGRRDPRATELLASGAMSRLLDQLSARFPDRIIIFDSPPLLVTTESRVLASYMGQIVMVVEAGRTLRESVKEALATLESSEVVGLVLNKSRETRADSYYGYQGYGYGASA